MIGDTPSRPSTSAVSLRWACTTMRARMRSPLSIISSCSSVKLESSGNVQALFHGGMGVAQGSTQSGKSYHYDSYHYSISLLIQTYKFTYLI